MDNTTKSDTYVLQSQAFQYIAGYNQCKADLIQSIERIAKISEAISYNYQRFLESQSLFLEKLTITEKWCSILQAAASHFHKTDEEIQEEHAIVRKAQKDPKFFGPIYERYFDSIFIFINKRLDNEDISGELTSLVFYKCLKNINKYRYQGVPFSAWLFRIAINEIKLYFRKEKSSVRSVSINDYHIDLLFEEMDFDEKTDKHQLVTRLLEQLSGEEVQFLELRFFENRSFKEMAYLLGLTEVNAKIKTYRIIKKLKKIITK